MSGLYFATCDPERARLFLKRFSDLNETQKNFVLNNLSKGEYDDYGNYKVDDTLGFRVCDPDFHPEMLLTEEERLVTELELLATRNEDLRASLFRYCYRLKNITLVKNLFREKKEDILKGIRDESIPTWYFDDFIKDFNEEAMDFLLKEGVITTRDINKGLSYFYYEDPSYKTIRSWLQKLKTSKYYDKKLFNDSFCMYWLEKLSGEERVNLYYEDLIHLEKDIYTKKIIKEKELSGEFHPQVIKKIIKALGEYYSGKARTKSLYLNKLLAVINPYSWENPLSIYKTNRKPSALLEVISRFNTGSLCKVPKEITNEVIRLKEEYEK